MNGLVAIVSNLFGWLGCFAAAGALVGIGLYAYRAFRGQAERGQSPVWMSNDAWLTPSRVVLASVVVLFVLLSVLFQQTPWTVMLMSALLATALVGMMPPEYRPHRFVSCLIAPLPLVAGLVANLLLNPGFLTFAAASLIAAALMRAVIGVPDAVYYGQQGQVSTKPRHMVWPGADALRLALTSRVHGQTAAIVQIVEALSQAQSLFSPVSDRPMLLVLAGPESCGRSRIAETIAAACQARCYRPNDLGDIKGDAFYSAVKGFKLSGEGCVVFMDQIETSEQGAAFLAKVALEKAHRDGDDWSKALLILPVTIAEPLPADKKERINVLATKVNRLLLSSSTIVGLADLNETAKAKIAVQLANEMAARKGLTIERCDTDALMGLVREMDRELAGAAGVATAVDAALHRKIEQAQLAGAKSINIDHVDGEIAVVHA